jgi:hypothetical protein
MLNNFRQLDELLRGDATRTSQLQSGQIALPVGGLTKVVIVLAMLYGFCMGSYGVMRTALGTGVTSDAVMQLLASTVKLPLLFLLTLAVTFPSLYVFNVLVGSRLSVVSMMRLLIAMLGVILAVLASLGPIVVFFALSTNNYPFMKILNVVMATIAGFLGLMFLLRTLYRLVMVQYAAEPEIVEACDQHAASNSTANSRSSSSNAESVVEPPDTAQAIKTVRPITSSLDRIDSPTNQRAFTVFSIWVAVFALVGAQMSWVLRPFVGSPDMPFAWFRRRESNFFIDLLHSFGEMFAG